MKNGRGIPGESGSSIIKVINGELYGSYGVLSTSSNLDHNRITDWVFYGIKTIIKNDLIPDTGPKSRDDFISVYPNPTK